MLIDQINIFSVLKNVNKDLKKLIKVDIDLNIFLYKKLVSL